MLTVTSPAASYDLTTLAAVKTALEVTGSDDDAFLSDLIERASGFIAAWCNRVFARETVEETFRLSRPAYHVQLARWPVASIATISEAGTALTSAEWEMDASTGTLYRLGSSDNRCTFPAAKIVVSYTAGYLLPGDAGRTLPAEVEGACIALVSLAYHQKGRDPLVKSATLGQTALSYWSGGNGEDGMPADVAPILMRYRQMAMG